MDLDFGGYVSWPITRSRVFRSAASFSTSSFWSGYRPRVDKARHGSFILSQVWVGTSLEPPSLPSTSSGQVTDPELDVRCGLFSSPAWSSAANPHPTIGTTRSCRAVRHLVAFPTDDDAFVLVDGPGVVLQHFPWLQGRGAGRKQALEPVCEAFGRQQLERLDELGAVRAAEEVVCGTMRPAPHQGCNPLSIFILFDIV